MRITFDARFSSLFEADAEVDAPDPLAEDVFGELFFSKLPLDDDDAAALFMAILAEDDVEGALPCILPATPLSRLLEPATEEAAA